MRIPFRPFFLNHGAEYKLRIKYWDQSFVKFLDYSFDVFDEFFLRLIVLDSFQQTFIVLEKFVQLFLKHQSPQVTLPNSVPQFLQTILV